MTTEIIEKYPDKPWDWLCGVSDNPNVTQEFIEKHIDKNWDWYKISMYTMLTVDFVRKYEDKFWNWPIRRFSENIYLTMDFIDAFNDRIFDEGKIENISIDRENDVAINYYIKRRTYTIQQTKKIEEELIQKAWHPSRFYDWCLDEEEK